jgi:hypothetical protein
MPDALFAVSRSRLYYQGEELLAGPVEELTRLAASLNAENPAHFAVETEIVEAVWTFMQTTRGCSFAVGPGLRSRGWCAIVPQLKADFVPARKGRAAA